MNRSIRRALKWPLLAALKWPWLRRKIVYELRKDYFSDLRLSIPLGGDVFCPLARHDYIYSFSEIFLAGEYGDFLTRMPLPRRWLDLGCHAGFFSLYLAWHWLRIDRDDFEAYLIDADPRVSSDVALLIGENGLERQFRFRSGLIHGGAGELRFAVRSGMGSSAGFETRAESVVQVPVLSAAEIAEAFPPPYDLIKLDIEGAEFDFFDHYGGLLAKTDYVLAEWHSWDAEGTGEMRMRERLARHGFQSDAVLQARKTHRIEGRILTAGSHLFKKSGLEGRPRAGATFQSRHEGL